MDVTIGLRGGSSSWKAAEEAGLTVKETAEAVKGADIVNGIDSRRITSRCLCKRYRS